MSLRKLVLGSTAVAFALVATPDVADACGGCFVQQSESTQVTGHQMVLGISQDQTTLYDQITYAGEPEEFAWVLPIRGEVDVSLSSDALFSVLANLTRVDVYSPQISCSPPTCPDDGAFNGGGSSQGGASGGEEPGVEIIAEEVVGPYQTVQLAAEDPAALTDWLVEHGYNIPEDIQPIIDAYVNEGFGFLAMRLVPGQAVTSMRPVAVTTPGAGVGLPLRMVAAGTGAVTPITLWIVGEGRYEPQNFPSFSILESELVWDWDEQRSNYADLKAAGFAASSGSSWLIEAGEPLSPYAFEELLWLAEYDPIGSGYADDMGGNAVENATADVALLTAGTDPATRWISRISAELSRSALGEDLVVQASASQDPVQRTFWIQNTVGTEPQCPPPPSCGDGFDGDGNDGDGSGGYTVGGGGVRGGCGSCVITGPAGSTGDYPAVLFGLGLAAIGFRRRACRKGPRAL